MGASSTSSRQVRLGIIGTGLAAKRLHWPPLSKMQDKFSIVAFANRGRAKAEEFAALARLTMDGYYSDYREMLRKDDVEAVVIGLPIMALYEATRDALEAGKHVIVEKPVGGNLAQAWDFAALAEQYPGAKVGVAENFFYRDDLRLARSLIDRGEIGALRAIFYRDNSHMKTAPGEWLSTGWRQAPEHKGGILLDAGVHHVAAIRMFGGDVERVSGEVREVNPMIAGLSSITANLRLASGVIGNYSASFFPMPVIREPYTISIYGAEGSLSIGHGLVRLVRADGTEMHYSVDSPDGGYYNEFLNFWESIVCDAPIASTIAENVKNAQVVLEAIESAEQGRTIKITEAPGGLSANRPPLWMPFGAKDLFDGLPVRVIGTSVDKMEDVS